MQQSSNLNNQKEIYIPFKQKYNKQQRIEKLLQKKKEFPNLAFIVVERLKESIELPILQRSVFAVSRRINLQEFQFDLKRKLGLLNKEQAMFLFLGSDSKSLPNYNKTMGEIYDQYKDSEDQWLYITYSDQNIFG
ncbi:hypothetical protein PPERSA_06043 [Pseudocohnilembus persalinus]|uniref:Autophagy-related protein n=1 Tax=Pseudocohnilembus persalinus TaxID=266149 RepID=A0A0V0QR21_PSEPJ|nr:hypothetical protein PPERSA_06043 [Pseudocohnilembus persalinus]|eukprot:KRX04490.1 hypothetical protein PPERSA_06043 [Pseudocohnilembus persalinus]